MEAVARVVHQQAFCYSASRKLLLQARCWRPVQRERAACVLAHHVGDHTGNLGQLGSSLAANGIALYAYDQQGWGRSETYGAFVPSGLSGNVSFFAIRSAEQTVADLDKITTKVMQYYSVRGPDHRFPLSRMLQEKKNPWDPEPPIAPQVPVFVLGHGMGAPIVTRFVSERAQEDKDKDKGLAGCTLVGPWVGWCPNMWRFESFPMSGWFASNFPLSRSMTYEADPTDLFSDVGQVLAWESDLILPKAALPVCTARIIDQLARQSAGAIRSLRKPLMVMRGGQDSLCPAEVAQAVLDASPSADKDLHEVPGSRHDVFADSALSTQNSIRALVKWMQDRADTYEPPPSALDFMDDDKRAEVEAMYSVEEGDLN